MTRPTLAAVTFIAVLGSTSVQAVSSGQTDAKAIRELRGNVCVNCRAHEDGESVPASRIERGQRIATRLAAPNSCAEPGATAWFAEEEDHLTAFLNSHSSPRYK
ncbi:MAG: hypothetical protein ABI831_16955 [Betaproteobacteria bacterium]